MKQDKINEFAGEYSKKFEELQPFIDKLNQITADGNQKNEEFNERMRVLNNEKEICIDVEKVKRWLNYVFKNILYEQGFKFEKKRLYDNSVLITNKEGFVFNRGYKKQYKHFVDFLTDNDNILNEIVNDEIKNKFKDVSKKIKIMMESYHKKYSAYDKDGKFMDNGKKIIMNNPISIKSWKKDWGGNSEIREIVANSIRIQKTKSNSYDHTVKVEYSLNFYDGEDEIDKSSTPFFLIVDEIDKEIDKTLNFVKQDKKKLIQEKVKVEDKIGKILEAADYSQYTVAMEIEKDTESEKDTEQYR